MGRLASSMTFGNPFIDITGTEFGDPIRDMAKWLETIVNTLAEFRQQATNTRNSNLHSPLGVKMMLASLGQDYISRITQFEAPLEKQRQSLAKLREQLVVKPIDADGAGRAIQLWECRESIQKLSGLDRIAALQGAVASGDEITVTAFQTAPKFLKLIDEVTLQQLLDQWAELRDPATAKLVSKKASAISQVERAMASAITAIKSEAGIKDDLLKVMAGGVDAATGGDNA